MGRVVRFEYWSGIAQVGLWPTVIVKCTCTLMAPDASAFTRECCSRVFRRTTSCQALFLSKWTKFQMRFHLHLPRLLRNELENRYTIESAAFRRVCSSGLSTM